MKIIKSFILLYLLIANASIAGQTVTISIVHPTRYSDNSNLPVSDISGYRIYYAVDAPATFESNSIQVGAVDSVELEFDLAPRPEPYLVNVAAQTLTAIGVSDLSSEASISKQIDPNVRPIAPIIIDITIICDAECRVIEGNGL